MPELYFLPFDHRGTFQEKLFGIRGRPLTDKETAAVADYKQIIYEGFLQALELGVPKEKAAILVDEQFGAAIARDAKKRGIVLSMPVEKSGQNEFDFEYGDRFGEHIEDFDVDYVKALVRYNPDGDKEANGRQRERLKILSDYCRAKGRKFLFELLVPATEQQIAFVSGSKERYEEELRPSLMRRVMAEMQAGRVEPLVWKLEGMAKRADYEAIVKQARLGGRKAEVIILGRSEGEATVEKWLAAGAGVEGVVGFAVGRTVFFDALIQYRDGKATRDKTSRTIAENYKKFCDFFIFSARTLSDDHRRVNGA